MLLWWLLLLLYSLLFGLDFSSNVSRLKLHQKLMGLFRGWSMMMMMRRRIMSTSSRRWKWQRIQDSQGKSKVLVEPWLAFHDIFVCACLRVPAPLSLLPLLSSCCCCCCVVCSSCYGCSLVHQGYCRTYSRL